MQVTAELRWFWNSPQDELKEWFCDENVHDFPAGGGSKRVDLYFRDATQIELGLKHRGGRPGVEIKGLVSVTAGGCTEIPFDGDIETWSKWTAHGLFLDRSKVVATEKQRWMRRFDTSGKDTLELLLDKKERSANVPERGCNLEFTAIRFVDAETHAPIEDQPEWFTLSFEAFGIFESLPENLCRTAAEIVRRNPPPASNSIRASYPKWLSQFAPESLLLHSAST